jgi:hypothetical protein
VAQPSPDSSAAAERVTRVSAFVSYAREDNQVRQDLCDALVSDGVDTTGDWTFVHGLDFRDQIIQRIRQSDVLLALLSPAFAMSDVARWEVEEAGALGKRILPVVIENVPDADALDYPALGDPQWAFLRSDDPTDTNRALLVKAIRTDVADLKQHTDLLLAAQRWQEEERDRNLLLRGGPLTKAGEWMVRTQARPADWFPKPTPLQEEYYRASVAEAERRKTRATVGVGALVVAAAIAVGVIVWVWQQRQALADQEASRQEAAQALRLIPFQRTEAAEHVRQALRLWPTPEALDAQRQLSLLRGALDVKFNVGAVTHVGFLRNGAIVALGNNPDRPDDQAGVFIRCLDDSDADRRYGAGYLLSGVDARLRSLASSARGHAIVAAGDRTVFAYSFNPPERRDCNDIVLERTPNPQVLMHTAEVVAVAVDGPGTRAAFGDVSGTVVVAELPSLRILNTIRPVPTGRAATTGQTVTAVVFSQDGNRVAVGTADGVVAVWPAIGTATKPLTARSSDTASALALHPTQDIVATATEEGVFLLPASNAATDVTQSLGLHQGTIRALAFSGDGRYLIQAATISA